uniref:hypothetical protein n=1 Tax=Yoonia sp. TaxID=2212373 RepID=UPI0040484068
MLLKAARAQDAKEQIEFHCTGHLRLSFVYKQSNPDHAITDEERHVGVANLIVDPDERTSNAQDLASNG